MVLRRLGRQRPSGATDVLAAIDDRAARKRLDQVVRAARQRMPQLAKDFERECVKFSRQYRNRVFVWDRDQIAFEDRVKKRLDELAGDDQRAAAICLLDTVSRFDVMPLSFSGYLFALSRGTPGWTPDEVTVMLRWAVTRAWATGLEGVSGPPLTAARQLDPEGSRVVAPWVRALRSRVLADQDMDSVEKARLLSRLRAVLRKLGEPSVLEEVLAPEDAWARELNRQFGPAAEPELMALVEHLALLSAPRPSESWRRRCVELVGPPRAREFALHALEHLATCEVTECEKYQVTYSVLTSGVNEDVARGVAWAAALTGEAKVAPTLSAVTVRAAGEASFQPKIAGAAMNALGGLEHPDALTELWRLRDRISHRALRKQLDTALATAAERHGVTPSQLVERSVPDHGLGGDGAMTRPLGEHEAVLAITDPRTVALRFRGPDGTSRASPPAALADSAQDEITKLKRLTRELRATLSSERSRVEGLLSADRTWSFPDWVTYYRDHPVTGAVTRSLLWRLGDGEGAWRTGWPDGEGFVGARGRALPAPHDGTEVRLWHPIEAEVDEIRAWRDFCVERAIRQPFKQVFREIYRLAPAERETRVYSNRFAAHVVRYRQLYALFKTRGWASNFLGPYDGGHDGQARGEFAEGSWRALLFHEPADPDADDVTLAATDQVRFERREADRWREVPLVEVPPLVFTEAMRDVDLFVSTTSIAADPEWIDRGEVRFSDYWRESAFADLPGSALVRRDALERILPATAIAARCSLTDRHLVVRGDLRTYKIHLGSAGVLMQPDDAFLCIVPAARRLTKVYLPFEEDGRLALILSKAFLLAADTRIKDQTIRLQIEGPA